MSRWILATVAVFGLACAATQSANAQVYVYGAPSAVYVPGAVAAPAVVTSGYAVPAYAPAYAPVYAPAYVPAGPVVPMAYSVPAYVPARTFVVAPVVSAPVVTAPIVTAPIIPGPAVRQVVRGNAFNNTTVTRVYGPTYGPHYARVHVHNGPYRTTVREVIR